MANLILDEVEVPEDLNFLILEDEDQYQKQMIATLNSLGFTGNFESAYDVKSAIEFAKENTYQFIFSDWNLPDGKGIEFLKAVRASNRFDKTPYIMVTTMDDINDILEATNEGADSYIVKPFNEVDLVNSISFAYKKRTQD